VSDPTAQEGGHHRWPGLDGLRGLAILLVLFTHLGAQPGPHLFWQLSQGGLVGVDVFFVLSGFLITSLLVSEWDRFGSIRLPRFYMRRALRLLPALLVMIAVVALATLTVAPHAWRQPTLSGIPYAVFYASDLRWLIPGAVPAHPGFMDPMWSLSVEEQFYLVWPSILVLVLAFVPGARRIRAMQLALAGAALIEIHRALMFTHGGYAWDRLYVSPDTHTDGLLIGCALAFIVQRWRPPRRVLAAAGVAGLAVVAAFTLFLGPVSPVQPALYFTFNGFGLVAIGSAFLIWSVVGGAAPTVLQRSFESSPMRFFGRISYALYLWNVPVMVILQLHGMNWIVADVIRTAAVVGLATASFYLVERRFLAIKARRWSSDGGGRRPRSPATADDGRAHVREAAA
jgi:peptidoglycan/LPS O-acetylase OafA/YrhL